MIQKKDVESNPTPSNIESAPVKDSLNPMY